MKRLLLFAAVVSLLLTGCAAQAPIEATVGTYQGKDGAEVQLDRAGKGRFLNIPARAVLGKGNPLTGPIEWTATKRPDGELDMRFYGSSGIKPGKYQNSGMSAVYLVDQLPEIQFTIGDPDEGHKLILKLVKN